MCNFKLYNFEIQKKKYLFPEDVFNLIKEYMNIYGIPILFIPSLKLLTKPKLCEVPYIIIDFHPIRDGFMKGLTGTTKDDLIWWFCKLLFCVNKNKYQGYEMLRRFNLAMRYITDNIKIKAKSY
jgi:hypothetical protein